MKKVIDRHIRSIFRISLLVLILFSGIRISARPVYDSTEVNWRKFDEEQIEKYRKDSSFYYEKEPTQASNWWESFINWLKNLLRKKAPDINTPQVPSLFYNLIMIVIILAVVGIIVWAITQSGFRGFITGKGARVKVNYEVTDEDIHEIAFDTELEKAERERDYRKAVRLRYLEILKLLTDRGWIEWQPNKTNHEYYNELRSSSLLENFRNLTHIFDYVWYGEFPVEEDHYKEFAREFKLYKEAVNKAGFNPSERKPEKPLQITG